MGAKRVTLVADELLGYVRTGGIGTATSFLALALARMGHRVEVLHLGPSTQASSDWLDVYRNAGVTIRHVPRGGEKVEPPYFARMRDTALALECAPSDVVIAQDLAAPAYVALRLRQLGLAFAGSLFVVLCHGTRRWITDTARKARVLPNAHAVTVLEQASIELADAVVSPSRYLLDWMTGQGWRLPETHVIPWFTAWAATGEAPPSPRAESNVPVRRVAFFGRLEERKGIRPFLEGLNLLDNELLRGLELDFLGRATPAWTPGRIEGLLSDDARGALRRVSFETDLDRHEALDRLREPGTLAVLPSFGETFGNAVRECLEHGIPFIASNAGAVPELVALEDQERVLFAPTAEGVAAALGRALANTGPLVPAQAALDDEASWAAWDRVLGLEPLRRTQRQEQHDVELVVLHRGSPDALERCLAGVAAQTYGGFSTIVVTPRGGVGTVFARSPAASPHVVHASDPSTAAMRAAGVGAGSSPWLLFLDGEDVPEPELLETLLRAQAASGADVVSCGMTLTAPDEPPALHLFAGEPRGLGALANGYGTVALLRRSLLAGVEATRSVEGDHDWPLLAALSLTGTRIVSVPEALVTRRTRPGEVSSDPVAALRVVELFESALPDALRSLARLAAGVEAEAARARTEVEPDRLVGRVRRRLARKRS